jgi:hypothetical protein
MRTFQRLHRIEQRVQEHADRTAARWTADLSHWTEEALDAAIRALEDEPPTQAYQEFQAWLTTLTPTQLLTEYKRELQQLAWSEPAREGYRYL